MRVLSYQSQAKFETTFKWKLAKIRRERASVCDRFAWKILQRKKHFECATTSGYILLIIQMNCGIAISQHIMSTPRTDTL